MRSVGYPLELSPKESLVRTPSNVRLLNREFLPPHCTELMSPRDSSTYMRVLSDVITNKLFPLVAFDVGLEETAKPPLAAFPVDSLI